MSVIDQLDPPDRHRYGVDWSVKATRAGLSQARFVTYGLERPEIEAFLADRGVSFGGQKLIALQDTIGPLDRVMVGADGARTKLYGDLDGNDPAMVCLDLWPDGRSVLRCYRRFAGDDVQSALSVCSALMAKELAWLLEQPECAPGNVFHIALQRFGLEGPYTGGDVGFTSDWEALARRDDALFRTDLMRRMLERHQLGHHLDEVRTALCTPPLGTVDYVGFRQLPEEIAVNLYAKKNPVVLYDDILCEVDKIGQAFRYRPLVLSFELTTSSGVMFRLRPGGDNEVYRRIAEWGLAYASSGDHRPEQLEHDGVLARAVSAANDAIGERGPKALLEVLSALQRDPRIAFARLTPDTTNDHAVVGVDQHYAAR